MPENEDPTNDPALVVEEFTAEDKASFQKELTKKNNEAKALRDRALAAEKSLQEIADKDKSDVDKSADRISASEKTIAELTRENVALAAGLTAAQAKRLSGTTREELEADAAEYAAELGTKEPDKADPIKGKPTENLRPGTSDPEIVVEETDPAKLAAAIPRSGW